LTYLNSSWRLPICQAISIFIGLISNTRSRTVRKRESLIEFGEPSTITRRLYCQPTFGQLQWDQLIHDRFWWQSSESVQG
jgi:hypothetical protein